MKAAALARPKNLSPAKEYFFKIKSRNIDGEENEWVTGFSTWTWAQAPGVPSEGAITPGLDEIEVEWDKRDNDTIYTNYWVEASTVSYGGLISTGVLKTGTTYCFLNLTSNASYYIRVKAINGAGVSSAYTNMGSSWTWIEPVTGISFDEVYESSITFSAEGGSFSNIGAGLSGVTLMVYDSEFYDPCISSTPYSTAEEFTPSGLLANTTYWFRANSRNGEGEANDPVGDTDNKIAKITRIQKAQGVQFSTITNTTIKVRPEGVDGFSGLDEGLSGAISSCTTLGTNSLWAQTTNYWKLLGLTPNTTYTFRSNSRNRVGLTNQETAEVSTMTASSKPQALPFTDVTLNTITANWNAGSPANPDGTEYQCMASSISSAGPFNWDSGWQTVVYYDFNGMSSNMKYYFKVRAKNALGTPTAWVNMGTKYTLIQSADDISIVSAGLNSITVKAEGTLSNLGSGLSGVFFEEQLSGENSDWITNTTWQKTELSENTSYHFRVRSRNGDAIDNPATEWIARATEIDAVSGVGFSVIGTDSIEVKPLNTDSLNNLGAGASGWNIEAFEDAGLSVLKSSTNWQQGTGYIELGNFTPNATYYFVGQSRNVSGSTTTECAAQIKRTTCGEPVAPVVDAPPSTADTDKLRVTVMSDGNPGYTEYLIAMSSDNWTATNYVQLDDTLGAGEFWRSSDTWHGFDGYRQVIGLLPGTTYWVKVKAKNIEGELTGFSSVSARVTRSSRPEITLVEPASGSETSQITVEWTATGVSYFVQKSTNGVDWNDFSGWITATSTSPAGLDVNKHYYFQVKAKNAEGKESLYSVDKETWTWSECPGSGEPSDIFVSSMTANWGAGGNPSTTEYYVECSTTDAFNGSDDKHHDWDDISSYEFKILSPNTKYYYRAKSKTDDLVSPRMSTWTVLNPTGKYTLIENPTAYWQMTGISSITVKAVNSVGDSLSNLGGNSAVRFAKSPGYAWQEWTFAGQWIFSSGLLANTTYGFKIQAKNGNETLTEIQGQFIKATKIELPTGLDFFDVRTTTAAVKCIAGNFTNLGVGDSEFRIRKAGYSWSSWFNSEDSSHTLTGLTPSSQVDFEIVSKNRENIANAAVTFSTYTRAQVSEIESVEGLWDSSKEYHTKITIDTTYSANLTGPDGVEFAVYKTVDNKYINPNTWVLTDLDDSYDLVWSTSILWYHKNLSANTGCGYKVKARNQCDIKTDFSGIKIGTTPVAAPLNMTHTANDELSDGVFTLQADCESVTDAVYYQFYIGIATGGWIADPTKTGVSDHQFSDKLAANTKYEYYATASKYIGDETFGAPSVSTESYTAIEAVLSNEWNIGSDSTTIIAKSVNGGFNNIEADLSGLRFFCYDDVGYSIFHSSSAWIKAESYQFTGLLPNTSYFIKVKSRNGDGDLAISPATGLTYYSTMTWTGAAVPLSAALSEAKNDSIRVTISSGSNPSWTLYSVMNIKEGVENFVDLAGKLTADATWYTWAEFGGEAGIVNTALEMNKTYEYKVRARNVSGKITAWSAGVSENTTGANPPGWAEYSNVFQTEITANWTGNGNPTAGTQYQAQISTSSAFEVAFATSSWTEGVFKYNFGPAEGVNLEANTKYYCRVRAKDSGGGVTDWTGLGSVYTMIEVPTGIVWEAR